MKGLRPRKKLWRPAFRGGDPPIGLRLGGSKGALFCLPPCGGGGRAACGEVGRGIISSLGEAELHSFMPLLPPAPAAAAPGHQPDAFGFRRGFRIPGGVHTLPHRFKLPELLPQLPIP